MRNKAKGVHQVKMNMKKGKSRGAACQQARQANAWGPRPEMAPDG